MMMDNIFKFVYKIINSSDITIQYKCLKMDLSSANTLANPNSWHFKYHDDCHFLKMKSVYFNYILDDCHLFL